MTSEKVLAYMLEQREKSKDNTMTETEERVAPTKKLSFGLWYEVPEEVTACWGARWIFPNDQLHDRQSIYGHETGLGKKLVAWLNGGALGTARETAATMAKKRDLVQSGNQTIVLFEDETGIIKGNPNASYGYVYVCAYLKEEVEDPVLKHYTIHGRYHLNILAVSEERARDIFEQGDYDDNEIELDEDYELFSDDDTLEE